MKSYWITYHQEWQPGPMAFSVHHRTAVGIVPPLPSVIGGKGYPRYHVEFDGFEFVFSSLLEIDALIDVLAQKNLPHVGPGSHWLNKLPGRIKTWHFRSKALPYLHLARQAFALELEKR